MMNADQLITVNVSLKIQWEILGSSGTLFLGNHKLAEFEYYEAEDEDDYSFYSVRRLFYHGDGSRPLSVKRCDTQEEAIALCLKIKDDVIKELSE